VRARERPHLATDTSNVAIAGKSWCVRTGPRPDVRSLKGQKQAVPESWLDRAGRTSLGFQLVNGRGHALRRLVFLEIPQMKRKAYYAALTRLAWDEALVGTAEMVFKPTATPCACVATNSRRL